MTVKSIALNSRHSRAKSAHHICSLGPNYRPGSTNNFNYKIKHGTTARESSRNYCSIASEVIDGFVKVFPLKRPSTPSSTKYSNVKNWSKQARSPSFRKAARVTHIDAIINQENKWKTPAPNSYAPVVKVSKKNQFKWTKDHQLKLFAECNYLASQSPAAN